MIFKKFVTSLVFLLVVFFCNPEALLAAGNTSHKNYTKPELVLADVSNRGAHEVANEIYSDSERFYFVLRQIAMGMESWLRVAVALHRGSDAGMSEMLSLSIGEALGNSPEKVFQIAIPEFQLHSICDGIDVDDQRFASYEVAIEAIKRRQNKVATLTNPELRKLSRQCIQMLEKSKSELAKFYGVHQR
jgi:hypothetical protein